MNKVLLILCAMIALMCAIVSQAGRIDGERKTDKTDSEKRSDLDNLVNAVIQVESGGNDFAVGDKFGASGKLLPPEKWSYGPMQISRLCLADVNKFCRTSYNLRDVLGNRELSIWCFYQYISHYATKERIGREPTYEDAARIWNGGPNGYKKSNTLKYWERVKKYL